MEFDLHYICNVIGNLSAIPVRLYQNDEQVNFFSMVELVKDPFLKYQEEVFAIPDHIGYFVSPYFEYYGMVRHKEYKLVIGPARQLSGNDQELKEIAFHSDVQNGDVETFVSALKMISFMPLNSFLQILCIINYILNGEKKSLRDIELQESTQDAIHQAIERERSNQPFYPSGDEELMHNSLAMEQTIMNIVRKGDVAALKDWIASAPAVRPGKVAFEQLRQMKNIFIVTATLVSRAAIRGGVDINEALKLSDSYIQKCELMTSPMTLTNLQYHMVVDFTEKVNLLRNGENPSKLMLDVKNYIRKHLSEVIKTSDLAGALYVSRGYLSTKFKQETGENLTEFILKEKIEEAKRLLTFSDKSILAISAYLGFSSQSHFNNAFKKLENLTPKQFRDHIHSRL